MISRMQRVWKRQKTIREICKYQPIKMTQQMKANLLSPDKDPMGAAITDYFTIRRQENYVYSHLSLKKMKFPLTSFSVRSTKCPNRRRQLCKWQAERFWMPVPEAVAIPWHCKKWERKFAPLTSPRFQSRLWQNAVYVMSVKSTF